MVTTNCSVDVPPTAMLAGVKDLETVGGNAATVKVAVAVLVFLNAAFVVRTEFGPSVFVTAGPAVAEVTFTETVQLPLAGILFPAPSTTVLPPAAAVTVPPQVVAAAGVAAFVTPAGYVSVNPGLFKAAATLFGFVRTMTNCETPPTAILAGLKDLATVTGLLLFTFKMLVAAAVFVPPLVVKAPAGIVLV